LNPLRRKVVLGAAAAAGQLMLSASAMAKQEMPTSVGTDKLDLERFVEDCIAANTESDAQNAVKEVLARAVSTPNAVLAAVGEPDRAGIVPIHRSETLTIFNARWTPQMNLMPHNHLMWANIGIYTGREDNILWRETDTGVEAYGAAALFQKDAAALPVDVVHSVTNPLLRFTGGIHIYGGDFFNTTRTQWNPETLEEEPSDGAAIREMFERENERLGLGKNS
jgi:predicted metal-dependent enzyme (double-stranded beta helix superfamily)